MTRDDLLALDAAKLSQLTNAGLVKRAQRELARGPAPALDVGVDGTVTARHGEVVTELPPGAPLSASICSCDARGMCRHRVLTVLAYQGAHASAEPERWSPGELADETLRSHLGVWVLRRATRRRREGYAALVLRPTGSPAVELATCSVRFLVPRDLSYARCDCQRAGPCLHIALAVWAHREADRVDPVAPRLHVDVGPRASPDARALEPALSLARELVTEGAAASGPAMAARFTLARQPLEAAGLRWPLDLCDALERALAAYADRDASYRAETVAALLTELHARARAARAGAGARRSLLGEGEPAETRLRELRLVSLGARIRELGALADGRLELGADVYLADPEGGQVLVLRRRLRAHPDALGPELSRRPVLRGVSLGALAHGQMVTRAAARRPDRELRLAPSARADTSVTPQRGAWGELGEAICLDDVRALQRRWASLPPAFVRPRVLADRVRVFAVSEVRHPRFHAAERTLEAELRDVSGASITMVLEHSPGRGHAVDAAMRAIREGLRFVSGEIHREGERLRIDPIALVTDRVIVLDLALEGPERLPRATQPVLIDPLRAALLEARASLDDAAHRGLAHLGPGWRTRAEEAATRLDDVGLSRCAARLWALGDQPSEDAWADASLRVRLALELG